MPATSGRLGQDCWATLRADATDDGLDDAWRPPAASDQETERGIAAGESLARYTSFRVGGPAAFLTRPRDQEELRSALRWARERNLAIRVIGGGSNLIVSDHGVDGLVIVYRGEKQPVAYEERGATIFVDAPAQMGLSRLARFCCERGWAGLDWAVGLPGTVGGAVANNAGAHGAEMIDRVERVTVMEYDGALASYPAGWLGARYRHTVLRAGDREERARAVLLAARLRLHPGDVALLTGQAIEHAAWRKQHQPRNPCAGSIFKNPPGHFAGSLIEEAGLKGRRVGGAQVSTVHANFIVNAGGATGADVAALIGEIRTVVAARVGIELETEVEFIGAWDTMALRRQPTDRRVNDRTT